MAYATGYGPVLEPVSVVYVFVVFVPMIVIVCPIVSMFHTNNPPFLFLLAFTFFFCARPHAVSVPMEPAHVTIQQPQCLMCICPWSPHAVYVPHVPMEPAHAFPVPFRCLP